MEEMDPKSTRVQFTQVPDLTPARVKAMNYLPSPPPALAMDTPRTVEVVAGDGIPMGAWAAGLFDCFDNLVPNCFMVTFCPCVALAQLTARLGVASYRVALALLLLLAAVELTMFMLIWTTSDIDDDYSKYKEDEKDSSDDSEKAVSSTFVIATIMVHMVLLVYIWQLRTKTRRLFQLPGSFTTDCLSSWFCSCCVMAQLGTHVRSYQPGNCSFRAPDVLQAYPGKSYAV